MEKKFKNGKLASFLKKNVYYVLMACCVVAIVTLITITTISNKREREAVNAGTETPIVDVGNNNNPNDNDDGGSTLPPVDNNPIVTDPIKEALVFAMPVDNYSISMPYADSELVFHATLGTWQVHQAVDLAVAEGTDVKVIADGTVASVTTNILEGTVVTVTHEEGYVSVYKSLDAVIVSAGDTLSRGDIIGKASDSAYNEVDQGTHLHLEVTKDDVSINPMTILPEPLK